MLRPHGPAGLIIQVLMRCCVSTEGGERRGEETAGGPREDRVRVRGEEEAHRKEDGNDKTR